MSKNLQRALEQQKRQTKPYNQEITGLLGIPLGGQKRVEVPNRNGYVFVRLRDNQSEVIQAYNNKVATSYGLPVILQREGNKYVVTGFDSKKYDNNLASNSAFVPRHGNQHSFDIESGGGGDIVWVYPRQFMPSLVIPSGSVGAGDVIVNSYVLRKDDGTWKYTGNTGTASLLPFRPTSPTGAIMALVYLDALTGNPGFLINSGTVFSNSITGSSQIVPFVPQITGSYLIPLAAIRLITGTSKISWDNIYDIRQFLHTTPTGSSGGGGLSSISVQDEGVLQGAATIFNFVGSGVQATISGSVVRVSVDGGGGSVNTGTLDARYLKLDASNDPLTGQLSINPGNAGGGVYVTLGATGSFSNYNGFNLHRLNSTSFLKYPIEIYDEGAASKFNYVAGLLVHYNDDRTLVDINPYAADAGILALLNSQNDVGATGKLLSLQNQDIEKFAVYGDGRTSESNGWMEVSETWTYASATTINIPSGGTAKYQKGMKIRFKQGGAYKYLTVSAVTSTLLTTIATNDYAVINAAITNIAYSFIENPFGWVESFSYTPTVSAAVGAITSYTVNSAKFIPKKGGMNVLIDVTITNNGTGATAVVITSPINMASVAYGSGRETAATGNMLQVVNVAALNAAYVATYNNAYPAGNNYRLVVGWFQDY